MANSIDGLAGNRGVAIDNNLKPSADKSEQAKGSVSPATVKSDSVVLTAEAKTLQQLGNEATGQTEYFDQERVDSIKKSIAEGQYAVDPQRVADKFMETEQLLGKI